MDFGALPPEINSARMYLGPGSGPMLAAAAAWDGLAAELGSAAGSHSTVVSGLADGQWLGPTSTAMATAATPYTVWMNTTAAQAKQAGAQAKAAAAAYDAAFAMTVPPPVIAANRAQLAALIATNILGQNSPAIAATEAHYVEMWAQDAATMYGYAGTSAAATKVSPFTAPQQITNPAGPALQAAAVAHATATSAETNTQTALSQFTTTVPATLQSLAQSPSSSTSALGLSSAMNDVKNLMMVPQVSSYGMSIGNSLNSVLKSLGSSGSAAGNALASQAMAPALNGGFGAGGAGLTGVGGNGAVISAGIGRASMVGAVSVPPGWTSSVPSISPATPPLPGSNLSALPAVGTDGMKGMYGGVPLAGSGLGGHGIGGAATRFGFRPTFVVRPPAGG